MGKIIKKCLNCNNDFESYESNQRLFCSRKCTDIFRTINISQTCIICGTKITNTGKKYCSKKCMKIAFKKPIITDEIKKTCINCGKVFYVRDTTVGRKRKCCTRKCAQQLPPSVKQKQKVQEYMNRIHESIRQFKFKGSNKKQYTIQVYLLTKRNLTKNNIKIPKGLWIDHKYSIREGFYNKVDIETIAHIQNIEFITPIDNMKKGKACSITLEELRKKIRAESDIETDR